MIRKFNGLIFEKSEDPDHQELTRRRADQRAKILRDNGFTVRLLRSPKTGLYDIFVRREAVQA